MTVYWTGTSLVGGTVGQGEGNPRSAYWDVLISFCEETFIISSQLSEMTDVIVLPSDEYLLLPVIGSLDISLSLLWLKDLVAVASSLVLCCCWEDSANDVSLM